jgi:HPt (histidine-containing phosphotransfer) domain-containing protein
MTLTPATFTSLDLVRALATTDGDRELLGTLAGMMPVQVAERRAQIAAARDARDTSAVARAAHALKGGLLTIAATPAVTHAADVERLAHAGDWPDLVGRIGELEAALDRLVPELERLQVLMTEPGT